VPEVLEHDCREMGTLGFKVPELSSKGVRTEILRNYNGVVVVDHPTGKQTMKVEDKRFGAAAVLSYHMVTLRI
jgi:hypothetical protein